MQQRTEALAKEAEESRARQQALIDNLGKAFEEMRTRHTQLISDLTAEFSLLRERWNAGLKELSDRVETLAAGSQVSSALLDPRLLEKKQGSFLASKTSGKTGPRPSSPSQR